MQEERSSLHTLQCRMKGGHQMVRKFSYESNRIDEQDLAVTLQREFTNRGIQSGKKSIFHEYLGIGKYVE